MDPVEFDGIVELLNRRHVMSLLFTLSERGPQRFTQLQDTSAGLAPKTLTARLEDMVRTGLVSRQAFRERPPRVEYSLTAKGRGLLPIYEQLYDWHLEHGGLEAERPPRIGGAAGVGVRIGTDVFEPDK